MVRYRLRTYLILKNKSVSFLVIMNFQITNRIIKSFLSISKFSLIVYPSEIFGILQL